MRFSVTVFMVALLTLMSATGTAAQGPPLDERGNRLDVELEENAGPAVALVEDATPEPDWGVSSLRVFRVGTGGFTPIVSGVTWDQWSVRRWATNGTSGTCSCWDAQINVSSGAQIVGIPAEVGDTSATEDVWLWLTECPILADPCYVTPDLHTSGASGKVILAKSPLDALITVDNYLDSSQFRIRLSSGDGTNRFRNASLGYRL